MTETVELYGVFSGIWRPETAFDEVARLSGEEFRRVKNRRTFRVEIAGNGYFVKHHNGCGWREIIKNLLMFKLPVTGAAGERNAIRALEKLGVPTMRLAAYGCRRNWNPARVESFIITEELRGMTSCDLFWKKHFSCGGNNRLKRHLTETLARKTATMHNHGINHRDCYLCHFMLPETLPADNNVDLHVIDLHRAQIRRKIPYRYRVKDVAGLYFSVMDLTYSRSDLYRFIRAYAGRSLRKELENNGGFWLDVQKTANNLYRKINKKR